MSVAVFRIEDRRVQQEPPIASTSPTAFWPLAVSRAAVPPSLCRRYASDRDRTGPFRLALNTISLPSGDQIGSRLIAPLDVNAAEDVAVEPEQPDIRRALDRPIRITATWRPSGASDGRAPG